MDIYLKTLHYEPLGSTKKSKIIEANLKRIVAQVVSRESKVIEDTRGKKAV